MQRPNVGEGSSCKQGGYGNGKVKDNSRDKQNLNHAMEPHPSSIAKHDCCGIKPAVKNKRRIDINYVKI